jgi:hypothetical protein
MSGTGEHGACQYKVAREIAVSAIAVARWTPPPAHVGAATARAGGG